MDIMVYLTSKIKEIILKIIKIALVALLFVMLFTVYSPQPEVKTDTSVFKILCLGDLLIANGIENAACNHGLDYPYRKVEGLLKRYDIVFANLESSITARGKEFTNKTWRFRASPGTASYLTNLKLDVLSVANNHMLDYGETGMSDTLQFLKKWGVGYTGAGMNITEARTPAELIVSNRKTVFLAYCSILPSEFFAQSNKPGTAPFNLDWIKKDIAQHKTQDNLVLISLHWGTEGSHEVMPWQIESAHQMIEAGADAIIGHHPHVIQGIEIYLGKPVIYSLGNAICGFYNDKYDDNIFVSLNYSNKTLDSLEIIPVAGKNDETAFQAYPLSGEPAERTLQLLENYSSNFQTKVEIHGDTGIIWVNKPVARLGDVDSVAAPFR